MEKRDIIAAWLRRFAMIHGFSMMMVYFISALVKADAMFDVTFLGRMMLFSLAGTMPGIIYYSGHELSEKEWWIRTVIHFVLLNVLLLPLSHAIGLWSGTGGMIMFSVLILVVDVLMHVLSFGMDWMAARDINRVIKKRRGGGNDA